MNIEFLPNNFEDWACDLANCLGLVFSTPQFDFEKEEIKKHLEAFEFWLKKIQSKRSIVYRKQNK